MSAVAIRAEGLGKRYRIGGARPRHRTLRESAAAALRGSLRRLGGAPGGPVDLWALRDVSFAVGHGEVLGIIGRNGAGKSTLLKLLSRVTHPTAGRADIRGRVGSLLEVGAGFHPELTGRDNIYLNGAILGMTRREIGRKFDEIVAFAEVEPFLDTPVKRYSSGMYMRLGFAIAAHLEPDIVIVDEVLAVGDAAFQEKCLGKMRDISRDHGRAVLFVSHNMGAIRQLCDRSLLLDHGRLVDDGASADVIARYLAGHAHAARPAEWIDLSRAARTGTGEARFASIRYGGPERVAGGQPYPKGPIEFLVAIESDSPRRVGSLSITICDQLGIRLINADSVLLGRVMTLRAGRTLVRVTISQLYLNPGTYRVGLWLADPISVHFNDTPYDHIESAFDLDVVDFGGSGNGLPPNAIVACDFDLAEIA